MSKETAEQDACRAEHFLTDETIKALCVFANSDLKGYERVIRNSNLSDRYDPGKYEFGNVMEVRRLIYSARDTDRHL